MTKHDLSVFIGLALVGGASVALASSGIPAMEEPLERVANSMTGGLGKSAFTIGLGWSALNWGRGTEHGKETFLGIGAAAGLLFGGTGMINAFGGASGAPLLVVQALPWAIFLSDAVGELLGHLVYGAWLWGGLGLPYVWRARV